MSLPAEAFASIGDQVTIAVWVNGDTALPKRDVFFQAVDSSGDRVLSINLPWSNSGVIWDAGTGGKPYDRIDQTANAWAYKGRWNHWVFTKDVTAGEMRIYLNGSLWHSDDGMDQPIGEIVGAYLGGRNGGAYYDGKIDELKLYNIALGETEVSQLYGSYEGFDAWLSGYSSLGFIGSLADEDSDGIPLLLEYILGGNPTEADTSVLPTVESSGDNFVFKFSRLAESALDTQQVFQYSADLVDWNDLGITGEQAPEVSVAEEIDGREEVTITIGKDMAGGGRLFGRLRVVR